MARRTFPNPRIQVVFAALLAAALLVAGLATSAAPVAANEQARGECRYVAGEFSDQLELIDLSTSATRIALRRNGSWVRTIDAANSTASVPFAERGGNWIARVYPKTGDRYDLACEVTTTPGNRTFCGVTFGDDAQLRFPGIDAQRIIVRVNDQWRATLPGDADRWTDPSPTPDGEYFIRVREAGGGSTDILCTDRTRGEFSNVGETTNGGFLSVGENPSVDVDPFELDPATGLDGFFSTELSGDDSAVLATELGRDTQQRTFRVHVASSSVDEVFPGQISFDGDTIVSQRSRGNIRVRQYDGADLVLDRWVLQERNLTSFNISGSGDFAVIQREVGGQHELLRVNLATRQATPFFVSPDPLSSVDVSFDADRVLVKTQFGEIGQVIDVATGQSTSYELDTAFPAAFRRISALSGDGSTLAISIFGCFDSSCPVEIIDLDSGERRVFVGSELTVVAVNQDGTRILLTEDEGEDMAILDVATRDITVVTGFALGLL